MEAFHPELDQRGCKLSYLHEGEWNYRLPAEESVCTMKTV